MAFQLSPGVLVTEKDLTNVVPAVSSSAGGYVGDFIWGPVNEIRTVSSEQQLVREFGRPYGSGTVGSLVDFYTAANFLGYGNNLQLVRAVGSAARNAVFTGTAVKIDNETVYEASYSSGEAAVGPFAARCPGSIGNSIRVSLAGAAAYSAWTYADQFDSAPGTSDHAAARGGSNDELHIIVIDSTGIFTGVAGTVLEKFAFVSAATSVVVALVTFALFWLLGWLVLYLLRLFVWLVG